MSRRSDGLFMSPLVRRLDRAIRQQGLLIDGDRVAAAVSGGSDSVALALALAALGPRAGWRLTGLIHVNHGLRPAADDDERFVGALAAKLGVPCEIVRIDVAARVAAERRSLESVARDARYRAFEVASAALGATVVATGHTLDDQAETVLMRLLRGSAARGVSAIRARRGPYVRPFLSFERAELREWLAGLGETYREDDSNASLAIARNRLRHRLMPIVRELAPGGVRALARFATIAGDDEQELERLAQASSIGHVHPAGRGVQLNRGWVAGLAPAIGRRVLRRAIEAAGGTVSARDLDAVVRLARGGRSGALLDLHRARVRLDEQSVFVESADGSRRPTGLRDHGAAGVGPIPLPVPGTVSLPGTGDRLVARSAASAEAPSTGSRGAWRVAVQASVLGASPLLVRTRRPGDRVRPVGAPGSRLLQDVFVDLKIPRTLRGQVPIVVEESGSIVWVAGVTLAHEYRVTAPEAGVVILELEKGSQ